MSTLKCSSVNAGARVSSSPPTSMALDGQLGGIQNCREDKHLLVSVSFQKGLTKEREGATLSVGSTISWTEVLHWITWMESVGGGELSTSIQLSASSLHCNITVYTPTALPFSPWWTVPSQTVSQKKHFLCFFPARHLVIALRKVTNTAFSGWVSLPSCLLCLPVLTLLSSSYRIFSSVPFHETQSKMIPLKKMFSHQLLIK